MKEWTETITYGMGNDLTHEKLLFEYMDEITDVPRSAGVYVFKNGSEFLYIGECSNLRKRISQHLSAYATFEPSKKFREEWTHVHYVSIPYDKNLRTLTEAMLLNTYDPKYNSNDIKRLAKKYGSEDIVKDIVYYARVAKLKYTYIAEEFGLSPDNAQSIASGSTGGAIVLPKDYSPKKKLDMTQRRNAFTQMSKDKFYEIRKFLAESELPMNHVAKLFDVTPQTIKNVKDLTHKRYKRWNRELLAEKTTV